jgi:hypothetical protein
MSPNGDGTWSYGSRTTFYNAAGDISHYRSTGKGQGSRGTSTWIVKPDDTYVRVVATVFLPDFNAYANILSGNGAAEDYISVVTDLPWLKGAKLIPDSVKKKGIGAVQDWLKKWKKAPDCQCFLAGTEVLMSDGSPKDIEDVRVGEKVLATDPKTGKTEPREVTALIVTEHDKHFNEISIATENGIEKISPTHEHPFWSPSRKGWVEARNLKPGMSLLTDTGETVIVTGNRPFEKRARTYNLTVAGLHTYYVLVGATPVLVHNSNCPIGAGRDLIDGQAQFHIIHGDRTGGGHKWPGQAGKTVFPSDWGTDRILDSVADVATSPKSVWTQQTGKKGALYTKNGDPSRWKIEGNVGGVNIRVIYEPATDRIITGFPYR